MKKEKKCKCYHTEKRRVWVPCVVCGQTHGEEKEVGVCWGTKECEECSCGGDESKCDFYPEKRMENLYVTVSLTYSGESVKEVIEESGATTPKKLKEFLIDALKEAGLNEDEDCKIDVVIKKA